MPRTLPRLLVLLALVSACGDNLGGNTAPTIAALTLTTEEDMAVTGALVVADADGDPVTITIGQPIHGAVVMAGGSFTYTPAENYNGSDGFSVSVSDGRAEAEGTISITVTPVNDAPLGVADSFATSEDIAHQVDVSTLLANDTDVEGDPLTITGVSNAANGSVTLTGSDVVFTPAADFVGSGSYVYTVSDGQATATVTVTITVGGVNDPPVAVDDAAATDEDTALVVTAATLVANDTDAENQTLSVTAVGNAVNGTVSLAAGSVTFTPNADFNGAASFEYTVSDGAATDTGLVTVAVAAINDPPVGTADAVTTDEDTALAIAPATLTANDTDVDSSTLTITAVGSAINGTVMFVGADIVFTPTANFTGAASFAYTVSDGDGGTDTVTVDVTVNPVNDPPIAVDDVVMTAEDTNAVIAATTLLANDIDIDVGAVLQVTAVATPTNGTVSLAAGTITFVPTADFNGMASFEYTVSDGTATDTGIVTVVVTPVNDPPVAVDDTATTDQDVALNLAAATLLANDTDVDVPTTLTITAVQGAVNGTVSLVGSTITFTPTAGFSGTASFEYVVSDGVATDVATVTVTVNACTPVDDSIACTQDICQNGTPVHLPNNAACELDGFACTVATCSTTTGCSETATDAACSDGVTCTADTCSPGSVGANAAGCVFTPANASCDDGIACTVDVCGAGGCTTTPDDTLCATAGDVCVGGSGCRTPPTSLLVTELGILGSGTAEMIELFNSGATAALDGVTITNLAGTTVAIHPASDPTGALGQTLTIAAGAFAWGVPNPANAANIPAGATFVYGDPGTAFSFADGGDMIAITGQDDATLDVVDFQVLVTDPDAAIGAAAFPAFAGRTTQLQASAIVAAAPQTSNDSGGAWCTTFRSANTAGAANHSCSIAVINEVLIDPPGSDDGFAFVELAGPGGGQIGGAIVEDIEGLGASAGQRNATPAATIPAGTRIPADGLLIVADETGTTGTTAVPNFAASDVIVRDMDLENGGGDSVQLILGGVLLDALGHDLAGADLATNIAVNGFAMFETATAITSAANIGTSMARDANSTDTDNNRNDFHNDPTPTPGAVNTPVTPTITSITPDDGLVATTRTGVRITGVDLATGAAVTVGGIAATSCTFTNPTGATCTFPAGTAPGAVGVVYTNTPGNGSGAAIAANGWTYTAALNETDSAAEADFCNLQFPASFTVAAGTSTPSVFGRIFEAGVTETPGAPSGITAEVGFGPAASNPTTANTWQFFAAAFNVQVGNDDEFVGTFTAPAAGNFSYAFRFSADGGLNWTYCDLDGAGSNAGLDFSAGQLGAMTVP